MVVPASGHQVRCIPWVQMDTFNKEIGFLRELNCIKCIEYILWGIPTTKSTFDVANMMKTATVKDVPFMWNSCLGKWYMLPYLVVPLISARVPLISTRVSSHCQAILLHHHPSPYPALGPLKWRQRERPLHATNPYSHWQTHAAGLWAPLRTTSKVLRRQMGEVTWTKYL